MPVFELAMNHVSKAWSGSAHMRSLHFIDLLLLHAQDAASTKVVWCTKWQECAVPMFSSAKVPPYKLYS